jgi:predicted GTPase
MYHDEIRIDSSSITTKIPNVINCIFVGATGSGKTSLMNYLYNVFTEDNIENVKQVNDVNNENDINNKASSKTMKCVLQQRIENRMATRVFLQM